MGFRAVADDLQAIKNIIYLYAELLDLGGIEGLRRLFSKTTVRMQGQIQEMNSTGPVQGLLERPVQVGIPSTKHVVTNVIIEIHDDGRSAIAR